MVVATTSTLHFTLHVMPRTLRTPLSARSVVASTLLGMHPPVLPARLLVRSGELFGIAEGTTRTAISRMVAAGELEAERRRRRTGWPGGCSSARPGRTSAGSRRAGAGTATVAHGGGRRRARRSPDERAALRSTLLAARYAELREGVWTRPDNLPGDRPDAPGCEWIKGEFAEPARDGGDVVGPRRVGGRGAGAAGRGEAWTPRLDRRGRGRAGADVRAVGRRAAPPAGRPAAAAASCCRDGWPGETLRRAYDAFDATFKRVWRDWYRSER